MYKNDENIDFFPEWTEKGQLPGGLNKTDENGLLRLPPGFVKQACFPGKDVKLPFTAFGSPPHWLGAPSEVLDSIEGLTPNDERHGLGYFTIQPVR